MSGPPSSASARGNEPKRAAAAAPVEFRVTPTYLLAVVSSWLVPGAGHWLLGHRGRAVVIAATLLGLFWIGQSALADNLAVTRRAHPIFFALQVGNGFSTLVSEQLWGRPIHPEPENTAKIAGGSSGFPALPRHLNLGILLASVSGLLNLLAVLHVMDPRSWAAASGGRRPAPNGPEPAGRVRPGGG